jgi:ABC-type lipoprotein export system ATPase subunit
MSPANKGAGPTSELLGFEGVSCHRPDGHRQIAVLEDASFSIERGTFVGVYGARRSGKSTLLRLAAGIELPDSGIVRIDGRETAKMSALERERLLRNEVGLVCMDDWHPRPRESVVDYVALALGSEGATLRQARRSARRALKQVGLGEGADDLAGNLSLGERLRAMLARAIVRQPRLLLVDEPAAIPRMSDRDELLASLRGAAQEIGATLIVASEEMTPLRGADLTITVGGEVNVSERRRGTVVPFPGARSPGGQGGGGGRASDGEARSS